MMEPVGFWRRAFAWLIDWGICGLLLAVFAPMLFAATEGRSQYAADFRSQYCGPAAAVPSNLELPPGFETNFAMDCNASFFGWPVGRVLSVGRQTVEGNVTTTLAYHFPLDAKGAVATGAIAGDLSTVVAVLFRLLFDTVARSPGRRLCGIVVADRAIGRRVRFGRLWRRYLLFSLPVGLAFLPVDAALSPASFAEAPSSLIGLASIPTLLSAALLLWVLVSIVRRRPAFYDRPVGTTVLRG